MGLDIKESMLEFEVGVKITNCELVQEAQDVLVKGMVQAAGRGIDLFLDELEKAGAMATPQIVI